MSFEIDTLDQIIGFYVERSP